MNEQDTEFQDFFEGFDGDSGNQTESTQPAEEITETEATESDETAQEDTQDVTTDGEEGGNTGNDTEDAKKENSSEEPAEPETFTIKVNKEERNVSRDELIALAQKGADYDRIREKLEKGKSDNTALTAELEKSRQVYDLMEELARDAGVGIPELMQNFRINHLIEKEGCTKAEAKARIAQLDAERELADYKRKAAEKTPEQLQQERVQKDFDEFQHKFPDVLLQKEDIEALSPDIQNGMSLAEAWQKRQQQKLAEENKRLTELLAAKEKNAKNRQTSPGSTNSSGSKQNKDPFDDFWSAFK